MTELAAGMRTESGSRASAVVLSAAMLLALGAYLLRLDRVAGLVVDDAWYVLLGRALARGEGYRLVSSATTAIMPVVPPGFPAILSLIFRVGPDFPQNVLLLKAVSIAAMMAAGLLTYRYFSLDRRLPWTMAVAIALATLLTPGLVFLATSTVMAESTFIAAQLLTVVVIEAAARSGDDPAGRRITVVAAILSAATMLVRSTGLAVIAAGVCYLLLERRFMRAALFAAVTLVSLLPWTLYARAHEPSQAERLAHGGTIAVAYSDAMRMRTAGNPQSGRATLGELPARAWAGLINVFGRDMGGVFVPSFLRTADESGEEVVALGGSGSAAGSMGSATAPMIISFALSAIALLGYASTVRTRLMVAELLVPISLAMAIAVPFQTFRYVLPLAPFLYFYLLEGVRGIAAWCAHAIGTVRLDPSRVVRVVILCLIGFQLLDHAQYIYDAHTADKSEALDWVGDAREIDALFAWMKQNLPAEGAVATTNPALVYLATGRKTLAIDQYQDNWRRWKAGGVRYAVALRPVPLPEMPAVFKVLYQSSRRKLWVIEM
jgi:hypothetical protein